jgi:hypothetical protein
MRDLAARVHGAGAKTVVDFDAVLRDPNDPTGIYPPWRNDCYHPNAAGDRILGDSIPLRVFGLPASGEN